MEGNQPLVYGGIVMRVLILVMMGICIPLVFPWNTAAAEGCDYEKYPVKVEITSVKELASEKSPRFEVRFVVLLTGELHAAIENRVYGRDYQMLLQNKTFPGPRFLEKYHISEGQLFDCNFNIRTRGNCRSSYFEFPDIKLDDYFERTL